MDTKEESMDEEEEEEEIEPVKKQRGRRKSSINNEIDPMEVEIKHEVEEEEEEIPVKRKRGRPKALMKTESKSIEVEIKQEEEDDEPIKKKRAGRAKNSSKVVKDEVDTITTNLSRKARTRNSVKIEPEITSTRRSRKSQLTLEENSIDETPKPHEEPSVRRSTRPRKAPIVIEPIAVIPSKKKRSMNGKAKASTDQSSITSKSTRSRRRRKGTSRRQLNDDFCLSTSSSDEHLDYLSDDDYDSDDYLPDPSQIEQDDNFFALDEDHHPNNDEEGTSELRSAKTAHASTIITTCCRCAKSDRPEVLLLCDDCDDAYHINCLRPKLLAVPDGDWYCPLCEQKKLSNNLIDKLKELLINFTRMEMKRCEREQKQNSERKIKAKEYSSDESITASESEDEQEHEPIENHLHGDESMLSASQTNENSNLSSTMFDDPTKNISQRGRHRRTRFDMNKMLNNDDESDEHSNTDVEDDEEYVENPTQITNFDVQIPKKMTRLLNHRYRPIARNDQRFKPKPIAPRVSQSFIFNRSFDHICLDLSKFIGFE